MRSLLGRLHQRIIDTTYYYSPNSGEETTPMDRDWDTLIILDALRHDTYEERRPDNWPKSRIVRSPAGNTWKFYKALKKDGPYFDTVAVTANPRTLQVCSGQFHAIIDAVDRAKDEELGTVPPDDMARLTLEAHEQFPDKRILSHWAQPHYPFIGDPEFPRFPYDEPAPWGPLYRGELDVEWAYEAYASTFDVVVNDVERVVDGVSGKVVVSADHGNSFGEHPKWLPLPVYGHPRGSLLDCLVEVPWVEFDWEERRAIEWEEADSSYSVSDDVERHLHDLGYA